MTFRAILSLFVLFLSSVSLFADDISRRYETFRLGRLLPDDSVVFYIEYPVLEPLTKEERSRLIADGFQSQLEPVFDIRYGMSRGERIANVSFIPVIEKSGRLMKLTDYSLRYRINKVVKNDAQRKLVDIQSRLYAAERYTDKSVLSSGRWVKIRVSKEGVYKLTYEQLAAMGFTNPSRVKLFGYGGRLLPDELKFRGSDAVTDDLNEQPLYRRTNDILFFAEGLVQYHPSGRVERNTFSSYSYYFLTEGDSPAELKTSEEPSGSVSDVDRITAHALYDNDRFVWYGGGRDFYDDNDLLKPTSFTLSLPGMVDKNVTLHYDVSGLTTTGAGTVKIAYGSKTLASPTINSAGEGESARGYRGTLKFSATGEQVAFTLSSTITARLNYLHAVYQQKLSAVSTTSSFSPEKYSAVRLKVANADKNLQVWQIGTAEQPLTRLPGKLNGSIYEALAKDGSRRFVLVNTAADYPSPEVVGEVANQNLHADRDLDYVIIVPASGLLTPQAERLAELHRSRSGLRVKVVNAGQIYNEFSSGTPDFTAYRRYMKMLYDRAVSDRDRPRYLLFFGDCSYDNRMILPEWKNVSPDDYLLASERNDMEYYTNSSYSIGTLHSYVTDDHAGYLDDYEGKNFVEEKLDLGIGRFACNTPEDAAWLVDQTARYMNQERAGVWQNRMWAFADVGDNNLHMNDAQKVCSEVEPAAGDNFLLRRIYPDIYVPTQEARGLTYPGATRKMKLVMEQGALIFNYNGHGRPDRLSHHFFLNTNDLAANKSHSLPLWIFASCEITPYDQPINDLGRSALYNKEGGAVAVLCAARSVYSNYNCSLNRGFIKNVFGRQDNPELRNTLGDALRLTKAELVVADTPIGSDRSINKLKYALLGDPAISLAYPEEGIRIDSINGQYVTEYGNTVEVPVGGKVRFSGYVTHDLSDRQPDTSFNGTLTGTAFMPIRTFTCKGTGNEYADPLVFKDYSQTLFEGNVVVRNGRFELNFVVPRGAVFSPERALLSLYAVNNERSRTYNGSFRNFSINGTAAVDNPDLEGPKVYAYLDRPDFPDGGRVEGNSTFYAAVSDSSAINMMSGNLGHDMELWLDDNTADIRLLNDYFTFDPDSYTSGIVSYPLQDLAPGNHKLNFRVWDVFDNSTTYSLSFRVASDPSDVYGLSIHARPLPGNDRARRFITQSPNETSGDLPVVTEVYNLSGMRVWHASGVIPASGRYFSVDWQGCNYGGAPVPRGVYFYRSKVGDDETKTHKVVIG